MKLYNYKFQKLNIKEMTKKITLFLAFAGMISTQSCTVNEVPPAPTPVDKDTISEVFEVTTSFNSGNNYSKLIPLKPAIYASDMILVYHLYDVVNGNDVWRQMPQTYYISGGGEIDYNFDFTKYDVNIFMGANFSLNTLSSTWTQNQTFRIVIVPGYFSNKNAKNVDFKDYNEVVKAFNINELDIKKINS
jgi:hypothetical protein